MKLSIDKSRIWSVDLVGVGIRVFWMFIKPGEKKRNYNPEKNLGNHHYHHKITTMYDESCEGPEEK